MTSAERIRQMLAYNVQKQMDILAILQGMDGEGNVLRQASIDSELKSTELGLKVADEDLSYFDNMSHLGRNDSTWCCTIDPEYVIIATE